MNWSSWGWGCAADSRGRRDPAPKALDLGAERFALGVVLPP